MNILYLSISYVPSRRASSVQVMKMCHAMAQAGHQIILATKGCPERQEPDVQDDHSFYGVAPSFEIKKLPRPAWRGGELIFSMHILRLLQEQRGKVTLVFSRYLIGAWLATLLGHNVVFEAHGFPEELLSRWLYVRLIKHPRFHRLILISEALKSLYAEQGLLPLVADSVVAHDGAELGLGEETEKQTDKFLELSEISGLGYIGNLYKGRGVELLVRLAQRIPSSQIHIIGGTDKDLANWGNKGLPPNLFLHGFVEPSQLHQYYQRFNILLMPYQREVIVASGKTDTSRWMSPLKMFEYMATGKPIISSDLPVLREVLTDGENALLVPPDDVQAWEKAVRRLQEDPCLAQRLGKAALNDLKTKYTWEIRAKSVLDGLE